MGAFCFPVALEKPCRVWLWWQLLPLDCSKHVTKASVALRTSREGEDELHTILDPTLRLGEPVHTTYLSELSFLFQYKWWAIPSLGTVVMN